MSNKKISLIIPCYNQSAFLVECLESVAQQTFTDWECILINDGSTDNTEEICKKWVEKDALFHYFKKENGGVSSARNFGIEKSTGIYILPLDGDDKIAENYLKLASEKLENGFDVVYCLAKYFGERNENFDLQNHTYENLLRENTLFCSALFKKENLNNLQFDENLIHGFEDWEFWISLLSNHDLKVFRLDETLFYYRIKEISRNNEIKKDIEKDRSAKRYIFNKHQDKYESTFGDYFQLLRKNNSLEKKNKYLNDILNSKKHQLTQKFFKIFGK